MFACKEKPTPEEHVVDFLKRDTGNTEQGLARVCIPCLSHQGKHTVMWINTNAPVRILVRRHRHGIATTNSQQPVHRPISLLWSTIEGDDDDRCDPENSLHELGGMQGDGIGGMREDLSAKQNGNGRRGCTGLSGRPPATCDLPEMRRERPPPHFSVTAGVSTNGNRVGAGPLTCTRALSGNGIHRFTTNESLITLRFFLDERSYEHQGLWGLLSPLRRSLVRLGYS